MIYYAMLLAAVLFFARNEFVFRARMKWLDKEGIDKYMQCPRYWVMAWTLWNWSTDIEKWRR